MSLVRREKDPMVPRTGPQSCSAGGLTVSGARVNRASFHARTGLSQVEHNAHAARRQSPLPGARIGVAKRLKRILRG